MWCLNTSLGTTRWPSCQRPFGFTPRRFWAVVLARGLTLIYTGHVPFSGSVVLGRPPRAPGATHRASSDLIGGWLKPHRSAVRPPGRRPPIIPAEEGGWQ